MKIKLNLFLLTALTLLGHSYASILPTNFNLAYGRRIEASSTCGVGVSEKELFCKLTGANPDRTDDSFSQVIQGQLCDYCDPTDPARNHPPEFAIDGSEKWWQSPPLSRGSQYNEVNLTIHLDQEFHVAYVYMRMGNSPRPGVFILERSTDFGKTWKPWQYFADTKSDCHNFFGHLGYDDYIIRDDSVVCTTEFSQVVPLEGGEIIVSLVNQRPSSLNFSYSPSLQEWTKATDVRFRFLRTKTLLGRLMAVANSDVTVTRRYYYSVKDISIGGHCVCNGHAKHCDKKDTRNPNKLICQCQHNTCGEHCDRCCPGFVQKPWKPATISSLNECEPCNCHSHSTECTYNEEVAQNRTSLDIHGNYEGGGVCHSCAHNTVGINCQKCKSGFFKSKGVSMSSPWACEQCRCDSRYSTGNCDDETGRCECRPEFAAPDCKSCSVGYYGYPNCKPCRCHVNGTEGQVCDSGAGRCPCKPNYAGPNCNQCAPDFYNFPHCTPCSCDYIGSQGTRCDPTTGQCICNARFSGRDCDKCAHGFYEYPNCRFCSCDTTGSTDEVCDSTTGACLCKPKFSGERCNQCLEGFHRFPYCIDCGCNLDGVEANLCQDNGQCYCKPNFVGKTCDQCAPGYYKYPECLPCNCQYEGSHGQACDQVTGQCHCRSNFEGVTCGECRPNYYNFPLCEECSCNPAGAKDIPGYPLGGCGLQSGGRLCHCKERVEGRLCDVCAPSYWRLSIDNPEGCEECECDTRGTLGGSRGCDPHSGQCVCKPFVVGRKCDRCMDGTFNLQDSSTFGCQPCNCDLGGSLDSTCDESGQCRCKPRVQGKKCDSPITTHFYPNLHHIKFELEEGRTRVDGPVRYGFDPREFPNFSWKGYAIFSKLQNEVLYDEEIRKPGLYKLLYRFINPQDTQTTAQVTVSPDPSNHDASEQSSSAVFPPAHEADYSFASSGAGVVSTFFLNNGKWTFALATPEKIFVDYMVLLPAAYYEATLLHNKFYMPCTLPATDNVCKHYVYVDLELYRGVKGAEGRARVGTGFDKTQTYENKDILDKLKLESMSNLNDRQTSLTLDVPVGRPGDYAFLVSYFTPDVKRSQELEVDVVGTAEGDIALLRLPNCPYTSPCRQYIHDSHRNIKSFHITSDHATLTLTGRSDVDVAIDRVYAIPIKQATPPLIEPKFRCIYRNEKCATGLPTVSVPGTRIDFEDEGHVAKKPPFPTTDPNAKVVQLHRSSPQVEIFVSVTKPDDYRLVPLYYQPSIAGFGVDVVVYHNGQIHKGVLHADYCPSMSGCHGKVTFKNHTNIHLSDSNVRITFNSTSPIWLDYIVIVPSSSYSDRIMRDNTGADESNEFIEQCASDDYDIDENKADSCKDSVYSLVTDFNNGALSCACNVDGSENFNCEPYGGQCRCKAHIIGRICSQCATGYWGFPNCQPCNCPRGLCDPTSGQCVCPPKVTGADCDKCLPRTFGFDAVIGCEDCNCHVEGVQGDSDCDMLTGECKCKANVGGRRCDACDTGHYDFPTCNACSCDPKGVVDDVCDQATSRCLCKKNVEGSYCDQCKDSTFHLEERNPMGCSKCFCFAVTTSCQSASLRWHKISESQGWELTNVLEAPIERKGGVLSVHNHQLIQSKNPVYWIAPPAYLGNKVTAYGGQLKYTVYSEKQDDSETLLLKPDLILEGGGMRLSYVSELLVNAREDHDSVVDLIESKFVHESGGTPVSRDQLMTVLARLETMLIRGTYFTHTSLFRIKDVELQVATEFGDGGVASTVEVCRCPQNYAGSSCESCSAGYYRENGANMGACVPCNCNNKAATCHPLTGVCQDCRDNFDGPQCLTCRQGHYHDQRYDVCRPCSCPSTEPRQNFASTCDVNFAGMLERCYCLPGYVGTNCERCAPAYWGQPLDVGGSCQMCECSGNIDERDPGACDQLTGRCLRCLGNTGGEFCERCSEGFYGDAIGLKNCQRCACDPVGTDHCQHQTGKCVCKPNVHGPTCSQCVSGAFGFHSDRGCEMCECGAASLTNMCDTRSGQCECRTGVHGRKCDQCLPGYWNYGPRGCQPCDCLSKGAVTCDAQTGACVCLPGVTGPNCDRCQPKWVMIEGSGCRECDSCIHLLIDDIEVLDRNVTSMREELENVTMGVQAFKKLEMVNRSIVELRPKVYEIISSKAKATQLDQLKDDLSQVQALTEKVLGKSEQVSRQCEGVSGDAVDIKKKANVLYDDILQKALHDVNEAVAFVKAILATITGSNREGANIEHLVKEAEEILEKIKSVSLDPEHKEASLEMERATEMLTKAKDFLESAKTQVNATQEINFMIEDVLSKLLDLQNHTRISMEKAASVNELNSYVISTKNHVAKMVDLIKSRSTEFVKCMENTDLLLNQSTMHIHQAKTAISGIQSEMMELEKALKDVDKFSNDLSSENSQLKDLVDKALEHTAKLERQSFDVQNLLTSTKSSSEAAIRASEAYERIVKAIEDALKAYEEALQAAKDAHEMSEGLAEKVVDSKEKSEKLRKESTDIYHLINNDVSNKLNKITSMLQDIQEVVVKENVTEVLTGVEDIRTKGLGDQAQNASRIAKEYLQTALDAQKKLEKYQQNMQEDSLNLRLLPDRIREMNNNIQTAESSLQDVSKLVPLSNDLISELLSEAAKLNQLQNTLRGSLNELRDQIQVARDTANLINVGVNFTGDSYLQVRNVKQMNSAGFSASTSLSFMTKSLNGLLYYIGNSKDEYMSLEVLDGYLVFKVNTGGGERALKSTKRFADNKWYNAEVSRTGQSMMMKVMDGAAVVDEVEGAVETDKQIITFDFDTKFYLGGVPDLDKAAISHTLSHPYFVGCIDNVMFEDSRIGLWNFMYAGNTRGSNKQKDSSGKELKEVKFDGDGYIKMEVERTDVRKSMSFEFYFKTFEKDGLLFYMGDKADHEDFLAFELKDGKVKMIYNLGSGTTSTSTEASYNTGKWVLLKHQRQDRKGYLRTQDKAIRSHSPGVQETLDVEDYYYIGGYKGHHNVSDVSNVSFKGCIKDFRFGSNSVNLFENMEAKGITAGCSEKSKMLSFPPGSDNSHVSIESPFKLDTGNMSISFKFRTNQSDALLFYTHDEKWETAMSLSVVDKRLKLLIGMDESRVEKSTTGQVDDSGWHYVQIRVVGTRVKMLLDETEKLEITMAAEFDQSRFKAFVLGSIPLGDIVEFDNLGSKQQFIGCLGDLSIDSKPVDWLADVDPSKRPSVTLSSCFFSEHIAPQPLLPSATPPSDPGHPGTQPERPLADRCHVPTSGKTSYEFDGSLNLKMLQHRVQFKNSANSDYLFEFKTTAPEGTIYYIASADHVDFLALYMVGGKVKVAYNCGTGIVRTDSLFTYNDGKWHTVEFKRTKEIGYLFMDYGQERANAKSPGTATSLEVTSPHSIGHLGRPLTEQMSINLERYMKPFNGCMREMRVDGELFEPDVIVGVKKGCRGEVEDGFFFAKGAVMSFGERFSVQPYLNFSIDIKPRSLTSVLFSVENRFTADSLILQMLDGNVYFSMKFKGVDIHTVFKPLLKNLLCDGNWHTIFVRKIKNVLKLTVDGVEAAPVSGQEGTFTIEADEPLYIGGVPEGHVTTRTTESFHGCIRNVRIDNRVLLYQDLRVLSGEVEPSCPLA